MGDQDAVERILASLHDAMLDDSRWPGTSALIDEACGLTSNDLIVSEGPKDDIRVLFVGAYCRGQRRVDQERDYLENYHPTDERVPRFRRLPDSRLVHVEDLFTAEELKTSPTYNEMLRRTGGHQPGHREPPQHRLDLFGVDRADHPVQGGFGDRHVAAGPEGLPGADRLQLRLTELSGVLGGGDRAAAVRKPGEDVDGEHRGHRVLASLGAPEVPDRGEFLVERTQAGRRLRRRPLRLPGGGQRAGFAQPLAGVAPQGVDVELLGPPVRFRVLAVVARIPAGNGRGTASSRPGSRCRRTGPGRRSFRRPAGDGRTGPASPR